MLDFLSALWEMSLTGAYAAAILIVLRLILKRRAPRQVLCLLWLVVFARLLIPVSLESPLSIVPEARPVQEQLHLPQQEAGGQTPGSPITPTAPVQNPAQGQTGTAAGPVTGNPEPNQPTLTPPQGVHPAVPQPEAPAPFPWQTVLAGVWLAGGLAMAGYGLISYLGLRRRLFDAIRAQDGAWEHPAVDSPFILGMLRPRIYLPAGLTGRPRQFILCHERAHLRRLDHIVKPVCWAALALHWFNPLVWAAYLLMSRDIEAACDESVIRRLGSEVKADYSTTLLALATGRRLPAPSPLAFDEGDAKGRIKNVLGYRRPALWVIVVSVIAAVMAAVCLLTDPVTARSPEDSPDPSPTASASQPPEANLADALLDPWMKEVLDGERQFARGSDMETEQFSINQLRDMVYRDEHPDLILEVGKLAVMDLDRDGINEMVVWPVGGEPGDTAEIGYTVGYFIFRRQGDEVTVHYIGWRPMQNLKADGTFEWSSSAWNWGISRLIDIDTFETEDITWRDTPGVDDDNYFVDGLQATRKEFYAAYDAQQAKPEPVWYVYEDGALRRMVPDIPMDAAAGSVPVPEFMTGEQQNLYRRAYSLYTRILGGDPSRIDGWPSADPLPPAEEVVVNGQRYVPANGLYARWEDFEGAVYSVFTRSFWNERNRWAGKKYGEDYPLFINVDGRTYYHPMSHAPGGYNGNFPETFWAAEQTDSVLAITMTGHYSNPCLLEGEDEAARAARYAAGYEYVIEFPLRMEHMEEGWRFEQFRDARTDDLESPFIDSHDPILRTTPDTTRVSACEHGLDYVFLDKLNGLTILRCRVDRYPYVIPAPFTAYNVGGGSYDDMDGDGRDEYSFLTDDCSTLMVCDVEDGRLRACTAQPKPLMDDLIQNLDYRYTDSGGVLTLETSCAGQTIRTEFTGSNRELVLSYGGKNAPVPGNWSLRVEPYTGQDVIIGLDLYIEGSVERMVQSDYNEPLVLVGTVQWIFRYENGALEYAPGGFRLLPLSEDWANRVY